MSASASTSVREPSIISVFIVNYQTKAHLNFYLATCSPISLRSLATLERNSAPPRPKSYRSCFVTAGTFSVKEWRTGRLQCQAHTSCKLNRAVKDLARLKLNCQRADRSRRINTSLWSDLFLPAVLWVGSHGVNANV